MQFRTKSTIKERITTFVANLNAFPQQIADITQEVVDIAEPEVMSILTFTPPRPNRKIEWTSEKQRRAYFATDGFGNGIPYRRKGNASKGWRLFGVKTASGAQIIVRNEWDVAKYIYGQFTTQSPQQRFHDITGWTAAKTQREQILDILITTYKDVIRTKGIQLLFD